VYFVVGFSGYGNAMGLVAGDRVTDLMLNGQDPGIFAVDRFDQQALKKALYPTCTRVEIPQTL
jgi:hypothetical protein